MPACLLGVPVGLTIAEEEDEVFGFAYPGLDIVGSLDGCSCLVVPEGWLLFLHWDRAAPISPRSPAPASLGYPHPWGTRSLRIPMLGPSLTQTKRIRVVFGVVKGHMGLHPPPCLWVLGQGRRGQQKGTWWGELPGRCDGATSMEGGGYRCFPQLPQPRSKQEPRRENCLKVPRRWNKPHQPLQSWAALSPPPSPPCGQPGWFPAGCPASLGTHCNQPGTRPHPFPHLG